MIRSTINNNIVNNERLKGLKDFLPKIKNKARWATFTIVLGVLARDTRQKKWGGKVIKIVKEEVNYQICR